MLSLGFALIAVFTFRTVLFRLTGRALLNSEQPYLRRVFSALWSTLIPSGAIAAILAVTFFAFHSFSILPFRVYEIVRALLMVIVLLAFVLFLTRSILAPGKRYWRLFNISEYAAQRLMVLISLAAFIFFGDYLFAQIRQAMSSPVAFSVLANFASTLILATVLSIILLTPLNETPKGETKKVNGWAPWFYWPMWLAILLIVGAALMGFVAFARFLTSQIIITGAILVTMYVSILSAKEISRIGALGETQLGNYLTSKHGFKSDSIDQLGLVLSIAIFVLTIFIGIPFILFQWGFQQDDVQVWLSYISGGFSIGDVRVSFGNIFLALLVFILGLVMTRVVQRWLSSNVLTRTSLDTGVKHSIGAGIGYFGVIVTSLLALSYTGVDLSSLTLIAGALSVGIGFGLQNVVNNFVSGIILLVERPIRVGDWIVVGNTEGFVKKISVRATQLETFDRQSIVVPNAELINTMVGNWMLKDNIGRLTVRSRCILRFR